MPDLHQRSARLRSDLLKCITRLPESVPEEQVHKLRTTARRLEALLQHAGVRLSKAQRRAMEDIGRLRKLAGKVRDMDVQITLLLSSMGNGSASADRRTLAESLRRKRAKQAGRLEAAAREFEGPKLLSRLAQVTEGLPGANETAHSSRFVDDVIRQLNKLAGRYASVQTFRPARLHELRTELKLLRYELELGSQAGKQKDLVRALESAQDVLGEWHDLQMLAESAEKQFQNRISCALLVEIRSLLAIKQSTANTVAVNLLAAFRPQAPAPSSPPQGASATRLGLQ